MSRVNSKHICRICGRIIFNKEIHSLYCKECFHVKRLVKGRIANTVYYLKQKGYKLTVRTKLIKTEKFK